MKKRTFTTPKTFLGLKGGDRNLLTDTSMFLARFILAKLTKNIAPAFPASNTTSAAATRAVTGFFQRIRSKVPRSSIGLMSLLMSLSEFSEIRPKEFGRY